MCSKPHILYQVVLRFQAARGNDKIFTGAGRHGILTALPQRDVEQRWHQIRDVFLDVKERRGQNRKDAACGGKWWDDGGMMVGICQWDINERGLRRNFSFTMYNVSHYICLPIYFFPLILNM